MRIYGMCRSCRRWFLCVVHSDEIKSLWERNMDNLIRKEWTGRMVVIYWNKFSFKNHNSHKMLFPITIKLYRVIKAKRKRNFTFRIDRLHRTNETIACVWMPCPLPMWRRYSNEHEWMNRIEMWMTHDMVTESCVGKCFYELNAFA